MNKKITRVWTFMSDSNHSIAYETLQYVDGTTSCNCKGWTRRVAADGSRSCKHTRYVDMGTADHHCTATHSYEQNHQQQPQPERNRTNGKSQVLKINSLPKLGQRKFSV